MKTQRILAPVDGSELSHFALNEADALASQNDGEESVSKFKYRTCRLANATAMPTRSSRREVSCRERAKSEISLPATTSLAWSSS